MHKKRTRDEAFRHLTTVRLSVVLSPHERQATEITLHHAKEVAKCFLLHPASAGSLARSHEEGWRVCRPLKGKNKIKSLPSSLPSRAPGLKNSEKPDGDSWAVAEPTMVATIMTATTTRLASIVIIISVARACPCLT